MSFGSSHDTKEQVRQATDLVDLVSRSIRLRRQGRLFAGTCPWHDDSRPSLQVNPERQSWKCWVCDIGGDVFSWVMRREGVEFPEALRILADRAGIVLARSGHKKTTPGSPNDKPTLYKALAWAEEQFHRCLLDTPQAEPARQYLVERGISQESIARFHLGFSPDSWQWLLDRSRTTSYSPAVLDAAGLLSKTQDGRRFYDRFRGRLIFSIRDTEHRAIAFGARILPQAAAESGGPKYVNSPETPLFSKSNQLYGLDFVRDAMSREAHIVVVEGYTDVIMAHQHGLNNVVAVLGTALGERHVKLLRRFADSITLVLDGDVAGQKRTNEILELFIAAQVELRILTLPSGLDPCDFLRERGADAFVQMMSESVDALEHKTRTATQGINLIDDPDRAHRALEDILKTIANSPRLLGVTSESMRLREQQMLVRLARQFHVEEPSLRLRLRELRERSRQPVAPASVSMHDAGLTPHEAELFEILLSRPVLVERAMESIEPGQLASPVARELWTLYMRAKEEGIGYAFEQIMTIAESSELKGRIAALDERAGSKAEHALEDAEERLEGLIRDFRFRRAQTAHRRKLASLEDQGYDDEEEMKEFLQRMIAQERDRQGISAPTDG